MPILHVLRYPHPILRAKCKRVVRFDAGLRTLVADMRETMYAHPGCVGIAAPQIGYPYRLFIIDVSRKMGEKKNNGFQAFVNPTIVSAEGEKIAREGCLSIPEFLGDVKRARKVLVKAQNLNGEEFEILASGLEAIAIQHEVDHLDGILFIDRVASLGRDLVRRKGH